MKTRQKAPLRVLDPRQGQIGANLKRLRKSKGYSQVDIASNMGWSTPYYSYVEQGKRGLTLAGICELAHFFKLSRGKMIEALTAEVVFNNEINRKTKKPRK